MDDKRAVALLRRGDISGLKLLVERYQKVAIQAAFLITADLSSAEDIVQTAFLRVFEKIKSFDSSRPFKPWFLRIVVNDAIKSAMRQNRQMSLDEEGNDQFVALVSRLDASWREPEDAAIREEMSAEVKDALLRLSPTHRAAIVMHYFLGLSTAEIAARLNFPPGTLRWHLNQAREKLRNLLTTPKIMWRENHEQDRTDTLDFAEDR